MVGRKKGRKAGKEEDVLCRVSELRADVQARGERGPDKECQAGELDEKV